MQKIILHLDMNSYFASVEQQANPYLRGKPVGVCEHLGGIIIAPSVEAKRLGISLGTPVWDAVKIWPDIALLPTDPDKYRSVTDRFMNILNDYTDKVERYSIDEAFLDITRYCNGNFNHALLLALEIKQRIRLSVGEWVSCSIGIGPNKLISKIAADLGSGDIDRIYLVQPGEVDSLYEMLELTDIPGIGKRYERRLGLLGIYSLKQLAGYPVNNLINQFGINGYFLNQMANFRDSSEIVLQKDERPKSIGHAYTMPKATSDLVAIKQLMFKLAEKVGRRLRGQSARGRVIHYFHSDKQYRGFSRQKKLSEYIFDSSDIYRSVYSIFSKQRGLYPIKIMGISISGLNFNKPEEPLFECYKKPLCLNEAMDEINDKYGEFTLRRARFLGAPVSWAKETVGFGRTKMAKP